MLAETSPPTRVDEIKITAGVERGSSIDDNNQLQMLLESLERINSKIDQLVTRQNKIESTIEGMQKGSPFEVDSSNPKGKELSREEEDLLFLQLRGEQRLGGNSRLNDSGTCPNPWGPDMASGISDIFTNHAHISKAKDLSANCSDNLCKVSFVVDKTLSSDEKELIDWNLTVELSNDLSNGTRYLDRLPDGGVRYTYFMAKKGYSLSGYDLAVGLDNGDSER
jgi:hypothetical protein